MDKQGIIETSKKRREGERIFYTSCPANGCWDSACVLKCHEKDGKIIAIEPDDSVNPNDSREDCGWENTWKGNVQMRPCAMGHSWKKELHADTRLLHPMKRVGKRGEGKFEEISWDEAIDTIAEKLKYTIDTYGNDAIHRVYSTGMYSTTGNPTSRLLNCLGGYLERHYDYSANMILGSMPYMYGDQFSHFTRSSGARICRGFHCANVAANHHSHQAGADFFITH